VKADDLDHRPDLGLGAPQQDRPPTHAQTSSEHREIQHQRGVGEDELAQIDDDVILGGERAGERRAPAALRRPVLVAATAQDRGLVLEVDDRRNLPKVRTACQAGNAALVHFGVDDHR
jgi:hypothetical protein